MRRNQFFNKYLNLSATNVEDNKRDASPDQGPDLSPVRRGDKVQPAFRCIPCYSLPPPFLAPLTVYSKQNLYGYRSNIGSGAGFVRKFIRSCSRDSLHRRPRSRQKRILVIVGFSPWCSSRANAWNAVYPLRVMLLEDKQQRDGKISSEILLGTDVSFHPRIFTPVRVRYGVRLGEVAACISPLSSRLLGYWFFYYKCRSYFQ